MNRRLRLERVEQGVRTLRPTANAVRAAMERFRKTGELPEDSRLARAVTQWAETGVNAYEHEDDDMSQAALIRAYLNKAPLQNDVVMEGLYEDAVYAPEPARGIAREILRILAAAGRDPSKRVWKNLGWKVPKKTCRSMALTLVRFPTAFVHRRHRRRTKLLAQKLREYSDLLNKDEVRIQAFLDASDEFQETQELPPDNEMTDAILWDLEAACYLRVWRTGEDCDRMIAALQHYWQAPAGDRTEALAEVQAAVQAGPQPGDPTNVGKWGQLRKCFRWLAREALDAQDPEDGPAFE